MECKKFLVIFEIFVNVVKGNYNFDFIIVNILIMEIAINL